MRLVMDTNILISYVCWPGSSFRPLITELLMNAEVLRSTETFAEIAEVIMRKKFDPYLAIAQRELFLASFYDNSTHVLISERIDACRDAKDNKFLELAVCGKAEYILTGDKDLLALTPYRATHIVNPSQLSTRLYANS